MTYPALYSIADRKPSQLTYRQELDLLRVHLGRICQTLQVCDSAGHPPEEVWAHWLAED